MEAFSLSERTPFGIDLWLWALEKLELGPAHDVT